MIHFISDTDMSKIWPGASAQELTEKNDSITNTIQEYCNSTFELVSYTGEKYDSVDNFVPGHLPIKSVASLVDNGVTLTEDTDFYVYPQKVYISSPSGYRKALLISYTAGYETVPEVVKTVALQLANFRRFKEDEASLLFYKTQIFEEREYEVQKGLSEASILRQLRRLVQRTPGRDRSPGIRIGVV